MNWIDDLVPEYGTVTGQYVAISYDSSDADLAPDVQPLNGTITLTPTVTAGRIDTTLAQILAVKVRVFGGQIVDDDDLPGVRILATDANIGVADWAWRATFKIDGLSLDPLTFKVPRDTTVNLTSGLVPIKSQPYQIVEGASIVDAEEDGAGKIRFVLSDGGFTRWIDIPNGEQGEKGDPGIKGDPGANGTAATLSMGAVTAGAAADAWMTGTPAARELNLVLPRGLKGDPGPAADLTGYAKQSWVSEQIGNVPLPDLTGYATEAYVDDAIANLGVPEGAVSGSGVSQIVVLTQAEYDALLPDATTLYLIREA